MIFEYLPRPKDEFLSKPCQVCCLFLYWSLSKCCDTLWRNISCFLESRAHTRHPQNKAKLLHWKLAQNSIHPPTTKKAPWKFPISFHQGFIKKEAWQWKKKKIKKWTKKKKPKINRTQSSPKKIDSKSPKGKKKKDKNQKIAMTSIKETYGEGRKR